jgi:AcrR family transcriptional regulator
MRRKENIETIYRASLTVFAEYGYHKATVADLAGRLNMTQGNLYRYANNKRDLYLKTVSHALLNWQARVREAVEKESDVRRQFLAMCFKAVEYLSKDDDLRRVLVHDPDIFPMFPEKDPFYEINQNSKNMIKNIIERGIREKKFRRVDPDRVSEIIFLVYKVFIIRTYVKTEDQFMQQMFEQTVELLTQGLFMVQPSLLRKEDRDDKKSQISEPGMEG